MTRMTIDSKAVVLVGLLLAGLTAACGGGSGNVVPTPPVVTATSPAEGSAPVAATVAIEAFFDRRINPQTVHNGTFVVRAGGVGIPGQVLLDPLGTRVTFIPSNPLPPGTTISATLTTAIAAQDGGTLAADHDWTFFTETLSWGAGARQFGTAAFDAVRGTAMDGVGNLYLVGETGGALTADPGNGGADIFLAKYDATGTRQWLRQLGTVADDFGYAVAVDGGGSVYLAGGTGGALTASPSQGGTDIFVAKYDGGGTRQWLRQFGSAGEDAAYGLAVDGLGNLLVAGGASGVLGSDPFVGGTDLFVAKYDSLGTQAWLRQGGTLSADLAYGVAADGSGNVYAVGATQGGLDGNAGAGSDDLFLLKYDGAGIRLWTRQLGTVSSDVAYGVALDHAGSVYVAGATSGALDGNLRQGGEDAFLLKYDGSGGLLWSRQFGTVSADAARSVACDPHGQISVAGDTFGSLGELNASAGNSDLFVVRYDGEGSRRWARQIGTGGADRGYGVETDGGENAFVAGMVSGALDANPWAGGEDAVLVKYDASGNRQ
ncbi:hypothetical protein DSOUD_0761 [Desulfuromonas soudanensis]|uniref:SbsA Ig-like domain-containing protein n=1 Tax=Desulfuromonas soudanensis TaxID=1603606 RepID=A0A0M5IKI6_9BACT|nr:SBBP repeat-containing protein [Desulfuromonas soudanensis]ALC15548.1 hypothetical protein DSOUD_0761 [Desulfuromonas soudanensis]